MLNIGKLSPGGGEYYIGEIASSAEDYYTGHGEAAGRWVGALAAEIGLHGEVHPDHLRRVLAGEDPFTGETLLSPQAARRRAPPAAPPKDEADRLLDTVQAASFLGVSAQYVRFLCKASEEHRARLAAGGSNTRRGDTSSYLVAARDTAGGWVVPMAELARFQEGRSPVKARPGFDLTLRPPKGVSILWALADDERRHAIRAAHSDAVDEVVRYYERAVLRARSSAGGRKLVETGGMIAAAFDHRTSRAGDPLLHSHVVVANLTRIAPDGTASQAEAGAWRAIFSPALFEHAKAAGFLYQAHLRLRLTETLGVEFGEVCNGYADVAGIPQQVVEVFSKRRSEIEDVLAESGSSSARAAQIATLDTRRAKDYAVDADTLLARWRVEAVEAGFDTEDLEACFDRDAVEALTAAQIDRLFDTLAGPYGLTERSSTFVRSDVIQAIAAAVGSACTATEITQLSDAFLASQAVVPMLAVEASTDAVLAGVPARHVKGSPTQRLYTTGELALLEDLVLTWSTQPAPPGLIAPELVGRIIGERPVLSDEQASMIDALCAPDVAVVPVAGRPGAGKTYATEAVVAAHVAAGIPILGCAVSATAAAELEQAARFGRSTQPATTIARLLLEIDRNPAALPARCRLVVDEASMAGTRDLHRLVGHARRVDGVVLLVGDPDQHGSVDVGGVFQRLCRDRGDTLVTLVENNRQQDPQDRAAIDDYREGNIAEALARYDEHDKIVRSPTAAASLDAMVSDWYADWVAGRADPMIAGPNTMRRQLNDRARTLLQAAGHLHGPPIEIGGRSFQIGDLVVARRNVRRIRSTSGEFVKNGSAGTVTAINHRHKRVTVEFERDGTIELPSGYLNAGKLEHGYARTTYGVQGATQHTARYHPTDGAGFEEGYVALTRGRNATRIYLVAGEIEHDDELSHLPAEADHVGLHDIVDSLGRRRANTMAADEAHLLADITRVLRTMTPSQITAEIHEIEQRIARPPKNLRELITTYEAEAERQAARRRGHSQRDAHGLARSAGAGPGAHEDRVLRRLDELRPNQQTFDRWEADNTDDLRRVAVLRAAEAISGKAVEGRSHGGQDRSPDLGP